MTKISARGLAAVAAIAALVAAPLAGCAGASTPGSGPAATSGPAEGGGAASGETWGCTPGILEYLESNGFPEPQALDPATISIPQSTFAVAPDCLAMADYGGYPRYSAVWTGDIEAVIADLGAALAAGGWEQSDEYGPYVWWFNGDGPTGAEHALGSAPQEIDGIPGFWASW